MARDLQYYHECDMAEGTGNTQEARALLAKLGVDDLRVLACHYWKIDKREARTLSRKTLIDELAAENGEDLINDMWRRRK